MALLWDGSTGCGSVCPCCGPGGGLPIGMPRGLNTGDSVDSADGLKREVMVEGEAVCSVLGERRCAVLSVYRDKQNSSRRKLT